MFAATDNAVMIRMANEGLPLGAMARCLGIASYELRDALRDALQLGKIFEMPAPDWPPTARKKDRVPPNGAPSPQAWLRSIDDDKLALYCVKIFHLTPLQGSVFSMLLRHRQVTKEMVHSIIEFRRSQFGSKTDIEETDLKMVDVVICHIRKRMKVFNDGNSPIETLWGAGYYIPTEFKVKAVAIINEFDKD